MTTSPEISSVNDNALLVYLEVGHSVRIKSENQESPQGLLRDNDITVAFCPFISVRVVEGVCFAVNLYRMISRRMQGESVCSDSFSRTGAAVSQYDQSSA